MIVNNSINIFHYLVPRFVTVIMRRSDLCIFIIVICCNISTIATVCIFRRSAFFCSSQKAIIRWLIFVTNCCVSFFGEHGNFIVELLNKTWFHFLSTTFNLIEPLLFAEKYHLFKSCQTAGFLNLLYEQELLY